MCTALKACLSKCMQVMCLLSKHNRHSFSFRFQEHWITMAPMQKVRWIRPYILVSLLSFLFLFVSLGETTDEIQVNDDSREAVCEIHTCRSPKITYFLPRPVTFNNSWSDCLAKILRDFMWIILLYQSFY